MAETTNRDPELARILLRRREVLGAVCDGSGDKRAIVEQLDIPRSTLDDVMRELSEAGLVRYADGEWVPTTVGRCAREVHEGYVERIAGLAGAATVLEPLSDPDIDPAVLDGCTVLEPDAVLPDRNVTAFTERVRNATSLRGLVPQALAGHVPSVHEEMVGDQEMTTELVFDTAVYDELLDIYPERTAVALDHDGISMYRASLDTEYGLWIADGNSVGVIVYAGGGARGILMNDSDAAVEWAVERFRAARDRAETAPAE
jgi:predicted transcriptional regulator